MDNRIGAMRARIDLQAPTKVGDVTTYVSVLPTGTTIAAQAWTVSSMEGIVGNALTLTRVQKFKIRYRSVLKSAWRVQWGLRYFNITGIDPDDKKVWIFLTCKEATS